MAPLSNGGHPITDYIIQRSPNGSTGWVTITDGVGTATSRTVAGLSNATRYHFRVFARTGGLTGPGSNVVSAIPAAPVPSAPGRARGVRHLPGLLGRLDRALPMANGAVITDYVIQVTNAGGSVGDVPRRHLDGDGHVLRIPGYKCKDIRVAAGNAAGVGAFSTVTNRCFRGLPWCGPWR